MALGNTKTTSPPLLEAENLESVDRTEELGTFIVDPVPIPLDEEVEFETFVDAPANDDAGLLKGVQDGPSNILFSTDDWCASFADDLGLVCKIW